MPKDDISDAKFEYVKNPKDNRLTAIAIAIMVMVFGTVFILIFMTSCSLTMQNLNIKDVEAHGHIDSILPLTPEPVHEHISQ